MAALPNELIVLTLRAKQKSQSNALAFDVMADQARLAFTR
ncbi:hypothetical protein VFA_001329 [Vibrio furnissii CIP 102972]|nr:hypothetical protein VFA_001329 [Vibrio furnissii CIP 102972]